ncbi:MAG: septation protein SepH [Actinomycetaceae bacterium]|nr:septation protein SepH [Actinomycetaceae bacterium]MDY5854882.1 septation protein SepH [Arcanobacterium sp.]
MIELELLGVEPSGEKLTLNDEHGNRYSLAITNQLRAALRQDVPRPSTDAKPMTPRDVQALFRAGKSVDDVTELSALPATQLLALERPILAERLYTAKQARSYRQAHELGGLTIEELVVSRLLDRGVAAEGITWDAYREAGEPWNLTATYTVNDLQHTALWRINTKAQAVTALNDEAAWLTETQVPAPASPWRAHNTPRVDLQSLRGARRPGSLSNPGRDESPMTPVAHISSPETPGHQQPQEETQPFGISPLSALSDVKEAQPTAYSPSASLPPEGEDADDIDIDLVLASLDSQRGKSRPMPDDGFSDDDDECADALHDSAGETDADTDSDSGDNYQGATVLAFPRQQQLAVIDDVDGAELPSAEPLSTDPSSQPPSRQLSADASANSENEDGAIGSADDSTEQPTTGTTASKKATGTAKQTSKQTSKQKRRRDRPTMPSWDEIVFGYAKKDDE